jgi:hypothetical protein
MIHEGGAMKRVLALVVVCAALNSVGAAPRTTPNSSLTIKTRSRTVKLGAEVDVIIHIVNTGDRKISWAGAYSNGVNTLYRYDCRDQTGSSVRKKEDLGGLEGVGPQPTIEPGESHDVAVPIYRACDLTHPGEYTIQISRSLTDGSGKSEVFKSNTITITVLPADQ